jgi:hypothetical protein
MARRFFIVIIYLFGIAIAFAQITPPPPPGSGGPEPPPTAFPINEDIFIVFIIALLYGLFVIFRHKIKFTSNLKSPF